MASQEVLKAINNLIGKTIKSAKIKYGGYTGNSEDEYPRFLIIREKQFIMKRGE